MVMMPVAAVLALRIGVRYVVVAGVILMAVGVGWMGIQPASTAYFGPIVMSMVTMAFGFSLINPPSTASIMGSLEPHQIASGSAVNSVTRELGGTLGVAVSGSVFSSLFTPGISTLLAPYQGSLSPEATKAATTSMAAAHQVANSLASHLPGPVGDTLTSGVSATFMTSFHRACIVIAVVGVIGAIGVFAPLSPKPATKETVRFE
jgi:hypothetical protein